MVVVVAVANLDQAGSADRVDLAGQRKRDLRPPAVLEPTGVDGAGRTRDREDHLLVLVAKHRRVLSHQLSRRVGAPLERLGDRRISRLGHLPSVLGRPLSPAGRPWRLYAVLESFRRNRGWGTPVSGGRPSVSSGATLRGQRLPERGGRDSRREGAATDCYTLGRPFWERRRGAGWADHNPTSLRGTDGHCATLRGTIRDQNCARRGRIEV